MPPLVPTAGFDHTSHDCGHPHYRTLTGDNACNLIAHTIFWEGAPFVAPATNVAWAGWPGIPRPAPSGGTVPVTLCRRRVSPLPCLVFSPTSRGTSPQRQSGRLAQVLPSSAIETGRRGSIQHSRS